MYIIWKVAGKQGQKELGYEKVYSFNNRKSVFLNEGSTWGP